MTNTPLHTYDLAFSVFGLRENPFQGSPDPRFFFSGRDYETVSEDCARGIESRRGLVVLTGEPGTGKTTLVRRLLQWLADKNFSSSYIFHSHLNSAGIFEFILRDFGIRAEGAKKSEMLAALHKWLQDRQLEHDIPTVIIDEAQALSVRALSELCLLLNLENSGGKLVQLVLVGQSELEEKLRRPELRQLRQRIAVRCRLPLLNLEDMGDYIAARLRCAGSQDARLFPPATLEALYAYAQGVPRVTNLLCEKAMMAAYTEKQSVVTPECVRRAAAEFDFGYEPRGGPMPALELHHSLSIPLVWQEAVSAPVIPPTVIPIAARAPQEASLKDHIIEVPLVDVAPVEPKPKPKAQPQVAVFAPKVPAQEAPLPSAQAKSVADARPRETAAAPEYKIRFRKHRTSAFILYWREVASSFVRDFRHFMGAFQTQAVPGGNVLFMKKYDFRRDVVAPVSRWLQKPVVPKAAHKPETNARQSGAR